MGKFSVAIDILDDDLHEGRSKRHEASVRSAIAVLELAEKAQDEQDYDPGLLNDYGGGNVGWWHDYIRYEVGRCNAYWRQFIEAIPEGSDG